MTKTTKLVAVLVCMAMVLAIVPAMSAGAATTADGFEYENKGFYVEINGFTGDAEALIIPTMIDGLPVASIGKKNASLSAFEAMAGLTHITIPGSIITIGQGAFEDCMDLETVIISDGVTYIDGWAFEDCSNLKSITIPTSVKSIAAYAFLGCFGITDVYYAGGEAEWAAIAIDNSYNCNGTLVNANIHYYSEGPAPEIYVTVNGAPIAFDVAPIAMDGTTMLPVRLALEPLGAAFVWNGDDQTVTINAKGKTIVLTLNSDTAYVNGVAKAMAKPAVAISGRTLIPIRFVAEELGYDVGWNSDTQTVIING